MGEGVLSIIVIEYAALSAHCLTLSICHILSPCLTSLPSLPIVLLWLNNALPFIHGPSPGRVGERARGMGRGRQTSA